MKYYQFYYASLPKSHESQTIAPKNHKNEISIVYFKAHKGICTKFCSELIIT